MDRKYRVVATAERGSLSEAHALAASLGALGIAAEIKTVDNVTELMTLSEKQLIALGSINFQEFTDLMGMNHLSEERIEQLWGVLLRNTTYITKTDTPLYRVDREAILERIKQKNPTQARRLRGVDLWEELLAAQSLDLTEIAQDIRSGEINSKLNIGPVSVDELTILVNLRASQNDQASTSNELSHP